MRSTNELPVWDDERILALRPARPAVDPWHARIDAREVPVVVAEIPYVGNLLKGLTEGWAQAIAIGLVGLSVWVFGLRRILYQPPSPALVGAAMTD